MNPHYHHSPYPEMNSPHSPHSDGVPIGYHGHGHGPPQCSPTANGHIMAPHRPPHLDHLHSPHPAFTGGSGVAVGGPPNLPDMVPNPLHHHHHHPHHHPHHHMINSTTNTNTNSNSNNNNANNNSTSNNSNSSNSSNNNSISSNLNSSMMVNGGTGLNGPNSNASSNGNNGTPSCVGGVNPIMNKLNTCSGCGRRIVERYLLHALDRYWHHSCLKCQCCGTMLADIESSCFTRNDMILCRADYLRLYGNTGACAACGVTIPANELVMRIGGNGPLAASGMPSSPAGMHHVFHPKCFLCSKCGTRLMPGDRYYLLSGNLVCEQDWHKLLKTSGGLATATGQPNTATGTTTVRKGKVGRPRRTRE